MVQKTPSANIDTIVSAEQLAAAVARLPADIGESVARKFVARHRDDPNAWRVLIRCVEVNQNQGEAVRLASQMLDAFGDRPDVVSYVGAVFCSGGACGRAFELLNSREAELDPFGALTLAQLHLLREPRASLPRFERILALYPGILEAALGIDNANALAAGNGRPVAFFLFSDWHRSIQKSVFAAAVDRSMGCFMTTTPWLVRALAPEIVVVSDTQRISPMRWQIPGVRIVHTRHGLGDKNYGYAAAGAADFVCVSSDAVADEYVRAGMFSRDRFWVTGYPQLDPMFARLAAGEANADERTVLFAPTFTPGLSAAFALGPDVVKRIRGNDASIRVIVRPHPIMRRTAPALLDQWLSLATSFPNVEFNADPDADIGSLMSRAAVMVSDVSSIALSYLALDRPLICLDLGPQAEASANFAPDGVEWRLHRAADVVSADALAPAVGKALADPRHRSAERRGLRQYLFGDLTDGHAGERIAAHIAGLRADA